MSPETQKVIDAFNIIIQETKFNFDITKRGRIIGVLPNGKYKVQIYDANYEIKSGFTFAINETVHVLFPQGKTNPDDL